MTKPTRTHRRPRASVSRRARRVALGVAVGTIAALLPLAVQVSEAASSAIFDFPCQSAGTPIASAGPATGDFNRDGRLDLAVGAPGDNLEQIEVDGSITRGVDDAGSINVVYSNSDGLAPEFHPTTRTRNYFSQNTPGVQETSEANDNFGFVLAAGNFDGQFGDDLAVGIPGENNGRGAVQILYSGPDATSAADPTDSDGLVVGTPGTPSYNQFLHQNATGVDGSSEDGDHFGYAIAAGYINADSFTDLVIGAPGEDLGTIKDAGVIHVLFGSATGLTDSSGAVQGDQLFQQGPGQILRPEVGRAEPGDFFGASLAIGNFNDTGPLDVAVGAPGEDVRSVPDGGAVRVMYSLPEGLSITESDFFTQQTSSVNGISETADRMGCSLAAGDFDGDDDDDLAVGVPGEGVGPDASAGTVQVLYNSGTITGITVTPNTAHPGFWQEDQLWTEAEGGIPGVTKVNDRMGAALAAADFDKDGTDDLAIGMPTELLYTNNRSGSVRVLYGFHGFGLTDGEGSAPATAKLPVAFAQSPSDLPSACLLYGILDDLSLLDPILDQINGPCSVLNGLAGDNDYSPLLMVEEEGDLFGASLAAGDFDNDGTADLAIGSPGEDLGLFVNWLTEEEATVPDEVLSPLLPIDEAEDAGAINVVYGPFPKGGPPSPPMPPSKQDLIYRDGNSPFGSIRALLHTLLSNLLQDNQVHPQQLDPSASEVLEGDNFGASQS